MNKIAMYEMLLSENPLWTKEAGSGAHVLDKSDVRSFNPSSLSAIQQRKKEWRSKSGAYSGLPDQVFTAFQKASMGQDGPPSVHNQRKVPTDVGRSKAGGGDREFMSPKGRILYEGEHHILHRWDMR